MAVIKISVDNIVATYNLSSADDKAEGNGWYTVAHDFAKSLDPENPRRAAAILAVLSPRLSWTRNIEAALDVYAGRWPKVLNTNARKAFRIRGGADPEEVVKGPKVRAFWHAIVDPSNPRAIVVDRHAIDVAAGQVLTDNQRGVLLGRKGAYDKVCSMYVAAAKALSVAYRTEITPVEVQATTWVAWRKAKKA